MFQFLTTFDVKIPNISLLLLMAPITFKKEYLLQNFFLQVEKFLKVHYRNYFEFQHEKDSLFNLPKFFLILSFILQSLQSWKWKQSIRSE